ncbi:MAG: DUF1826 domain-containing protein [Myxococcota bacterium]
MSDDLDMKPPNSPCYSCRDPEPNREALIGYLRQQREWITLGRRSKPAVEGWLQKVVEGESFTGSVVVDANDPWIDELIELLPPGPERLYLYADMSSLIEFYAGLSGNAKIRVCFAMGSHSQTAPILEGRKEHWMACCYAGPKTEWACADARARQSRGLESQPGDVLLSKRDDVMGRCIDYESGDLGLGDKRLVMRIVVDR